MGIMKGLLNWGGKNYKSEFGVIAAARKSVAAGTTSETNLLEKLSHIKDVRASKMDAANIARQKRVEYLARKDFGHTLGVSDSIDKFPGFNKILRNEQNSPVREALGMPSKTVPINSRSPISGATLPTSPAPSPTVTPVTPAPSPKATPVTPAAASTDSQGFFKKFGAGVKAAYPSGKSWVNPIVMNAAGGAIVGGISGGLSTAGSFLDPDHIQSNGIVKSAVKGGIIGAALGAAHVGVRGRMHMPGVTEGSFAGIKTTGWSKSAAVGGALAMSVIGSTNIRTKASNPIR